MVKFTVNEEGKVCNVQLTRSSGKADIDKLLMEVLAQFLAGNLHRMLMEQKLNKVSNLVLTH